jgi:ABC-type phosphate/phosphonate transport system substrate-binding protein
MPRATIVTAPDRIRAVTLLGDNTVPILDGLCRHVGEETGFDILVDGRLDSSSGAVARAEDADLIWACGYLMCDLIDSGRLAAQIVAAPIFAGEEGPVYHSVIVAADPAIRTIDDARGRRLAINEPISWSGYLALVDHLGSVGTDLSIFERVVATGSHLASVEAVAGGEADIAAIDHTVWSKLVRQRQVAATLRAIDRTRDWPAPPFAVHRRISTGARRAIVASMSTISPNEIVDLEGVAPASRVDYDVMSPPRP